MYTQQQKAAIELYLQKAKKDLSKLTKKVVTDKTGKKKTVWVSRPDNAEFMEQMKRDAAGPDRLHSSERSHLNDMYDREEKYMAEYWGKLRAEGVRLAEQLGRPGDRAIINRIPDQQLHKVIDRLKAEAGDAGKDAQQPWPSVSAVRQHAQNVGVKATDWTENGVNVTFNDYAVAADLSKKDAVSVVSAGLYKNPQGEQSMPHARLNENILSIKYPVPSSDTAAHAMHINAGDRFNALHGQYQQAAQDHFNQMKKEIPSLEDAAFEYPTATFVSDSFI